MKEFRVKGLDDDFSVVILRFPPLIPTERFKQRCEDPINKSCG